MANPLHIILLRWSQEKFGVYFQSFRQSVPAKYSEESTTTEHLALSGIILATFTFAQHAMLLHQP